MVVLIQFAYPPCSINKSLCFNLWNLFKFAMLYDDIQHDGNCSAATLLRGSCKCSHSWNVPNKPLLIALALDLRNQLISVLPDMQALSAIFYCIRNTILHNLVAGSGLKSASKVGSDNNKVGLCACEWHNLDYSGYVKGGHVSLLQMWCCLRADVHAIQCKRVNFQNNAAVHVNY